MLIATRDAFLFPPKSIASPLGPLLLGIVDPHGPAIAEGISRLLVRSITDARAQNGGHLPEWLVDDIERNYISPEKVRSLWAPFGHRFVVLHDDEIIGTVHLTKDDDTIFTIDRELLNVSARAHPGFKPERHHHLVNLSVKHELRRARIASLMIDAICTHFRDHFGGVGLWVRGDPPWHIGLDGLGFVHDPSLDVFLPASVERTRGMTHEDFNALWACACRPEEPTKPDALALRPRWMKEKKLQYVSFTRAFDRGRVSRREAAAPTLERTFPARSAYATDFGRIRQVLPEAVARPRSAAEVASVLAWATAAKRPVAVRGRGQSVDGQALTNGVVVSTERLDRIVAINEGERPAATAEAGVTWRALVNALAPRGLVPPIVTGWLGATVGGTLSTAGFSKGSARSGFQIDHVEELVVVTGDGRVVACSSRHAGWLFESALGGLGAFGAITQAKVRLERREPWVEVERQRVFPNDLEATLTRAADAGAWHVTAWADGDAFIVATARSSAHATRATIALRDYLDPPRVEEPAGPTLSFHVFVPPGVVVDLVRDLQLGEGDALQVLPIRSARRATSLHQCPLGAAFAVCLTRTQAERDARAEAFLEQALARGGKAYVAGLLPRDWSRHLGAAKEVVRRRKMLADPAGILGPNGFLPRAWKS